MDVARLNFSHGTHEEHARMIDRLRRVAEKEGRNICILQDLQGPKIRTGRLKYRTPIALKSGLAPDYHAARYCRHGRGRFRQHSNRWRRKLSQDRAFCSLMD